VSFNGVGGSRNGEKMCRMTQESVRRKRPELWPDTWILHHGNPLAYDALRVGEFLAKKFITKMDHPHYSPDLVPCNFCHFPKLKKKP
jgi:hypothetical protein